MKRVIDLLRLSAKLLLAVVLVVMVTGFLTAKPGLLGGSFSTYRWLHTRLAPLLFLPVLYVHSTTGLLFLISRSKRWNRPAVRRSVVGLWLALGAVVAALYFVEPRRAAPPLPAAEPDSEPTSMQTAESGAATDPTGPASDVDPPAGPGPSGSPSTTGVPETEPTTSSAGLPPPAATRPPTTAAVATAVPVATAGPTAAVATPPTRPSGTTTRTLDSNAVVQDKCTGCHGLQEVYAEKRTTAEWNEVIDRMVAHGADLTAAERAAVLRIMPRR